LSHIEARCREIAEQTSEIASRTAAKLLPVLEQARMLAGQYDCVVANPPYMGTKYYNAHLKTFVNRHYIEAKADLYACFIHRNVAFSKTNGFVGMITIPNWMSISSFAAMRKSLFEKSSIESLVHNGRGVFGSDFGSCNFVLRNTNIILFKGSYRRLFDRQGSVTGLHDLEQRFFHNETFVAAPADFLSLPGSIIAYWASPAVRIAFSCNPALGSLVDVAVGLQTSNDARFVRQWHEVSHDAASFNSKAREAARESLKRWFPFNKGGAYRKWFGNGSHLVNWYRDGQDISAFAVERQEAPSRTIRNANYYFQPGITWSSVTIGRPSFRLLEAGSVISHVGPAIYSKSVDEISLLAYLNSAVVNKFLEILSPTAHFETGQIRDLPFVPLSTGFNNVAQKLVALAREDWNASETSWDFRNLPVLDHKLSILKESLNVADAECIDRFRLMKENEEENNRLFIQAYGLQGELSPEVPDDQITLYSPNLEEDIKRLISYAIGCTMGRYSLDTPGLIYAHGGNVGFDPGQYRTFPADPDGIVPVMEADWFADDAANRFVEFLGICWPGEKTATEGHGRNTEKESKELSSSVSLPCPSVANSEDLKFVADALGPNKGEQPRDTIHRYLATGFFKHHLQTYKRRPIYWLFSSGKQRAFQCLVYLHRYHDGTLARMRTEYVIPLQGKLASRIDQLAGDIPKVTSTSHRTTLTKERDKLIKQQAELQAYDEKLRHYADMRLTLDLDDGVKVNYGKFGDLLAEVKAVTGGKDEE
jgi:hypothetical protein